MLIYKETYGFYPYEEYNIEYNLTHLEDDHLGEPKHA